MPLQGGRAWVGGSRGYVGAPKCLCLRQDPQGLKASPFPAMMLTWLDSPGGGGGGGMLWGTVIPDPPGPGAG